jgi:D-threonate/D-erythronate kinase
VLLVAGSVSEMTRQQVAAFAARSGVDTVVVDPSQVVGGEAACSAEMERCRRRLRAALDAGRDCVLVIDPHAFQSEGADRLVDTLGRIAADGVESNRMRGLILTGGDTARAVCHHLGVTGIHLLAEVQPGVPLGRLVGNPSTRLLAVTKAGAFGSERTLLDALDQLKGDR